MKISVAYINPGGNPTALVVTLVKRLEQVKIAEKVMKKIPTCEQVGFVERAGNPKAEYKLQMAGGEFCGNALRSMGTWLATQKKRRFKKSQFRALVESSGTSELITLLAKVDIVGKVRSSATQIPLSANITFAQKAVRLGKTMVLARLVNLDGITFLLVPEKFYKDKIAFRQVFAELYRGKNFRPKVCGLIFYQKNNKISFTIKPIVYVRNTNTIIQETSCASGSVALMLGKRLKYVKVFQPSGCFLSVRISEEGMFVGGEIISIKLIVMKV